MAFRPHRFGRYVIVDPIAVGGMAEIYRARLAAGADNKEGPDRILVIKKVIANLSQNSEFLQMFEAEIKITVGLTHPNIVQIYDYGRVDDQSFLAMEYVEGKNLRQFISRLAEAKSMFSIDMSCHIVSQVCQALSYAHNFKDRFTGKPLQIVHRDISPQNIMMSYEGAVKLFDFGIAKAKSASDSTRAGVIKGKPSYLSPEQISGEELDGRSDIFALGIVLWELLTAKRLFVAENDMAILRMIQSAKIEAPSTFNPAVPASLDAIVLKSLARDRNKRYASAEEFQRDLHRFLYSFNPAFNPSDLSYYAKELFEKEIIEDRERLLKFLAIEPEGGGEIESKPGKPTKKSARTSNHRPIDGIMTTEEFNRAAVEEILQSTKSQIGETSNTIELEKGENSGGGLKIKRNSPTPPPPTQAPTWANRANMPPPVPGAKRPTSEVIPPWSKDQPSGLTQNTSHNIKRGGRSGSGSGTHARLLAKELNASNSGPRIWVILGTLVAAFSLVFIGGKLGYIEGTPVDFLWQKDMPIPEAKIERPTERKPAQDESKGHDLPPGTVPDTKTTTSPVATAPSTSTQQAIVVVKCTDPRLYENMRVSINNGPLAHLTGHQLVVPIKTKIAVRFAAENHESFATYIEVPEAKTVGLNVDLRPLPIGRVTFSTTPNAKITFFSDFQDPIVRQTPLVNEPLAEGRYRAVLENEFVGHHSEFEVVIQREKLTALPEKVLK